MASEAPHQARQTIRVHHRPLPSRAVFAARLLQNASFAVLFLGLALVGGAWGYHAIAGLRWVDAFLDASMILAGMGPVATLTNDAAKIFASAYALFSGVAFLSTFALLIGPIVQRFLHKFHLDLSGGDETK